MAQHGSAGRPEEALGTRDGEEAIAAEKAAVEPRQRFSPYVTLSLILLMLLTGTCNTILGKLQDMQCIRNCTTPPDGEGPPRELYEQPVWQTVNMFLGEFMCLLAICIGRVIFALRETSKDSQGRLWSFKSFIWGRPGYKSLPTDPAPEVEPAVHTAVTVGGPPASPGSKVDEVLLVGDDADTCEAVDEVFELEEQSKQALDGWKPFLLWLPTLCDITATTLMNVGLILISASVYQMLRGGVVIFTGTFSNIFLGRRFQAFQWAALVFVMVGVGIVGASPILESGDADAGEAGQFGGVEGQKAFGPGLDGIGVTVLGVDKSVVGLCMVLLAQVFTATQFILEERILGRYHLHPLMAVGLEGTFGLLTTLSILPIADHFITPSHPGSYFDMRQGFYETFLADRTVLLAGMGCVASIAVFNWCGLEVTRRVSATSRSTVDTCRTIFIWGVSLGLGWEHFRATQVVGFVVLLYGTLTYNGIIRPLPFLRPRPDSLSMPPSRSLSFGIGAPVREETL